MILDLETIYVVTAIACFVLGAIQLAAYALGRFGRWPLWWGLSDILIGIGSLGVVTTRIIPFPVAVFVFNIAMIAGFVALLIAVRAFAGGPVRWRALVLGTTVVTVPVLLVWNTADDYGARVVVFSGLSVFFDLSVLREGVSLVRRDKLKSAWILVGLFGLTASMFALRGVLAATGHLSGRELFLNASPVNQWMMATAAILVVLRGTTLILMAAERNAQQLLALSRRDPLTGALNRTGMKHWFDETRRVGAGASTPMSLLLVDIDWFKTINDTYGHAVGDQVLELFASVARTFMEPDDMFARHGGDEFVLARPGISIEQAASWAEGLRQNFAAAADALGAFDVPPTLSIGVVRSGAAWQNLDRLLSAADKALYRSKCGGRNRVEWLDEPTGQAA